MSVSSLVAGIKQFKPWPDRRARGAIRCQLSGPIGGQEVYLPTCDAIDGLCQLGGLIGGQEGYCASYDAIEGLMTFGGKNVFVGAVLLYTGDGSMLLGNL
eukprot:1721571-Rhodomonas_salina.1